MIHGCCCRRASPSKIQLFAFSIVVTATFFMKCVMFLFFLVLLVLWCQGGLRWQEANGRNRRSISSHAFVAPLDAVDRFDLRFHGHHHYHDCLMMNEVQNYQRYFQSQNGIRCCAMATITVVEKQNCHDAFIVTETVDKIPFFFFLSRGRGWIARARADFSEWDMTSCNSRPKAWKF